MKGSAVFLDTSIQIARRVHSREQKARIGARLRRFDIRLTSLGVRQEFRRRLLREAAYLLTLLERKGTVQEAMRHLADVLPPQSNRKRNIGLDLLLSIDHQDSHEDQCERARLFLRHLLRFGLRWFDESVDKVLDDSRCFCAGQPIVEKRGEYSFGIDKCADSEGRCGVSEFFANRIKELQTIAATIPEKGTDVTPELRQAREVATGIARGGARGEAASPCLKCGDLLIALESVVAPTMYTMNKAESQVLCKALGQELVVRPRNAEHEDEITPAPVAPCGDAKRPDTPPEQATK